MSLTLLGSQSSTATTTTQIITLTSTPTAAKRLVLVHLSSATSATVTIVDSKGNTWTSDAQKTNSGGTAGLALTLCSSLPGTALVTGDTVTITSTSSGFHVCALFEPSQSILSASFVDISAAANNTAGTTTPASGSMTPATSGDLIYGVTAWENTDVTITEAGGWTHDSTLTVAGSKTKSFAISEQVQAVAGPVTYSASIASSQWVAAQIAYRISGGVTPGTLTYQWTGVPTSDGFFASTLTAAAASVRLKISTTSDLLTSPTFTSAVVPDANQWAQHSVTGLASNIQYWYGVEVDGVLNTSTLGKAHTLPTVGAQTSFTVAYGSCLNNTASATGPWTGMLAFNPLMFLHLGDFHYADIVTNDQPAFRSAMQGQIAANTGLKLMLATVPSVYISSDHDSGPNDWSPAPGVQTPAFDAVYRELVPHMALQATDSNYFAFTVGRVRFIFLDTRAYRSANSATDDASKTMIGATQKAWLKTELVRSEPVKCICMELPWIETPTAGSDKWGGFSTERAEITSYIQANSVNAMIIHGDAHMLAADDGTNAGGIAVFCAAPFSQNTSIKGGPYSGGTWPAAGNTGATGHHYGRLDFVDAGSSIGVTYTGTDADAGLDRITMTKTWMLTAPSRPTTISPGSRGAVLAVAGTRRGPGGV